MSEDPVYKLSGGLLISQEMAEDLASWPTGENWMRQLMQEETAEHRAAREREARRLRNRLRRHWAEVRYRVTTAIDVLAGRHYCKED